MVTKLGSSGDGHTREFPAMLEEVRRVRQFAAGVVASHPCADEVLLAASELAANAVEHSTADRHGRIRVRVVHVADAVHIEVEDPGGAGVPQLGRGGQEATRGRGLLLVDNLSRDWGITHDRNRTRVWCEIGCACTGIPVMEEMAA